MQGFGLGAVAILDALGFRSIWRRENAREVIKRLKCLRREGLKLRGSDRAGTLHMDSSMSVQVICISDTIIVSAILKDRSPSRRHLYKAMHSVSLIAGTLIDEAINGTPSLLLRGALAAGELLVDSNFVIGPAVDEAAQWFEAADGPFFCLTPSAMKINSKYSKTYYDQLDPGVMFPYKVPFKDGTNSKVLTFGYFGLTRPLPSWVELRKRLHETFGNGPLPELVANKRRNAIAFLNYVDRQPRADRWKRQVRFYQPPKWDDLSYAEQIGLIKLRVMAESLKGKHGIERKQLGFPVTTPSRSYRRTK